MARKTDIIDLLVEELKRIDKSVDKRGGIPRTPYQYKSQVSQVFPTFKFIQEINDFPSICLIAGAEARTHIGGGIRFGILDITIKGYVYAENAIDASDDLLSDIEFIVNSLGYIPGKCASEIEEAIVNNVGSDEGLGEPFGVCQVDCEITYQLDEAIGLTTLQDPATFGAGVFSEDFSEDFL